MRRFITFDLVYLRFGYVTLHYITFA